MIGISTKTIYAVAALHQLNQVSKEHLLTIKEIAHRANIPQNFLEQILLALKKEGVLTSVKGAHGGYKLAKDLKDVTLKEVILVLESDLDSDMCKTDNPALKLFWKELKEDILSTFDIPLSKLKEYQLKATQALDYSI